MKIDRIEAFAVGNPWKNWLLVRVSTDQGHTGWGEATTGLTTMPAFAAIGEIARLFIGRDPRDIQRNWQDAHKALYLSSDGVIMAAMAGIETACWDIVGHDLGLPLYRLLGGRAQDRIRTYANGWYQAERDPARFAERTRAVAAKGYSALKFDPLGHNHRTLDRAEGDEVLADVLEVQVVGEAEPSRDLVFRPLASEDVTDVDVPVTDVAGARVRVLGIDGHPRVHRVLFARVEVIRPRSDELCAA